MKKFIYTLVFLFGLSTSVFGFNPDTFNPYNFEENEIINVEMDYREPDTHVLVKVDNQLVEIIIADHRSLFPGIVCSFTFCQDGKKVMYIIDYDTFFKFQETGNIEDIKYNRYIDSDYTHSFMIECK